MKKIKRERIGMPKIRKMRKMNTEARKCLNLLGNVSYHSMLKMRKSLRNKFISEKVCVQS